MINVDFITKLITKQRDHLYIDIQEGDPFLSLEGTIEAAEFIQEERILQNYLQEKSSFEINFVNRCRLRNSPEGSSFATPQFHKAKTPTNTLYYKIAKTLYGITIGNKSQLAPKKFLYLFLPQVTDIIYFDKPSFQQNPNQDPLELHTCSVDSEDLAAFVTVKSLQQEEWFMDGQYLFNLSSLKGLALEWQEQIYIDFFLKYPVTAKKMYKNNDWLIKLSLDIRLFINQLTLREAVKKSMWQILNNRFDFEQKQVTDGIAVLFLRELIDNIPNTDKFKKLAAETTPLEQLKELLDTFLSGRSSLREFALEIFDLQQSLLPLDLIFDRPIFSNKMSRLHRTYLLTEQKESDLLASHNSSDQVRIDRSSLYTLPITLVKQVLNGKVIDNEKNFLELLRRTRAEDYASLFFELTFVEIDPLTIIFKNFIFLSELQIKHLAPLTRQFFELKPCADNYRQILYCPSTLFLHEFLLSFTPEQRLSFLNTIGRGSPLNYFNHSFSGTPAHSKILFNALSPDQQEYLFNNNRKLIIDFIQEVTTEYSLKTIETLWTSCERIFSLIYKNPEYLSSILKYLCSLISAPISDDESHQQTAVFQFLCDKIDDNIFNNMVNFKDGRDGNSIFHSTSLVLLKFLQSRLSNKALRRFLVQKNTGGNTPLHWIVSVNDSLMLFLDLFDNQWPSILLIKNSKGENILYQMHPQDAEQIFINKKQHRRKLAPALLARSNSGDNAFIRFISQSPELFVSFAQCFSKKELCTLIQDSQLQHKTILDKTILDRLPPEQQVATLRQLLNDGEVINILIREKKFLDRCRKQAYFDKLKKQLAMTPKQEKKILRAMCWNCFTVEAFVEICTINSLWLTEYLRGLSKDLRLKIFFQAKLAVGVSEIINRLINWPEILDIVLGTLSYNPQWFEHWLMENKTNLLQKPVYQQLLPIIFKYLHETSRYLIALDWKNYWLRANTQIIGKILDFFKDDQIKRILTPQWKDPLFLAVLSPKILSRLPKTLLLEILVAQDISGQSILSTALNSQTDLSLLLDYILAVELIEALNRPDMAKLLSNCMIYKDILSQYLHSEKALVCEPSLDATWKRINQFSSDNNISYFCSDNYPSPSIDKNTVTLLEQAMAIPDIALLLITRLTGPALVKMAKLEKYAYLSFFRCIFSQLSLFQALEMHLKQSPGIHEQFYAQLSVHLTTLVKELLDYPNACLKFLDNGPKSLLIDAEGNTLLHELVKRKDKSLILTPLEQIWNQEQWSNALSTPNNAGETPLFISACHNSIDFAWLWQKIPSPLRGVLARKTNPKGVNLIHSIALFPESLRAIKNSVSPLDWQELEKIRTPDGKDVWHLAISSPSSLAVLLESTAQRYEQHILDEHLLVEALINSESLDYLLSYFSLNEAQQIIKNGGASDTPLFIRCISSTELMHIILKYFSPQELLSHLQDQVDLQEMRFLSTAIILQWLDHLDHFAFDWLKFQRAGQSVPVLFQIAAYEQIMPKVLSLKKNKMEILLTTDLHGNNFMSYCFQFPPSFAVIIKEAKQDVTTLFTQNKQLYALTWSRIEILNMMMTEMPESVKDYLLSKNEQGFLNLDQIAPYSLACKLIIFHLPKDRKNWIADNICLDNWLNHPESYIKIREYLGFHEFNCSEVKTIFNCNRVFYQSFLRNNSWNIDKTINACVGCIKELKRLHNILIEQKELPSQSLRMMLENLHDWLQKTLAVLRITMLNHSYQSVESEYQQLVNKWDTQDTKNEKIKMSSLPTFFTNKANKKPGGANTDPALICWTPC